MLNLTSTPPSKAALHNESLTNSPRKKRSRSPLRKSSHNSPTSNATPSKRSRIIERSVYSPKKSTPINYLSITSILSMSHPKTEPAVSASYAPPSPAPSMTPPVTQASMATDSFNAPTQCPDALTTVTTSAIDTVIALNPMYVPPSPPPTMTPPIQTAQPQTGTQFTQQPYVLLSSYPTGHPHVTIHTSTEATSTSTQSTLNSNGNVTTYLMPNSLPVISSSVDASIGPMYVPVPPISTMPINQPQSYTNPAYQLQMPPWPMPYMHPYYNYASPPIQPYSPSPYQYYYPQLPMEPQTSAAPERIVKSADLTVQKKREKELIKRNTLVFPFIDFLVLDYRLKICPLCMCYFSNNDLVRSLRCLHNFHVNCVDQWIAKHWMCPVVSCRTGILADM